jgi:hypothetical protein
MSNALLMLLVGGAGFVVGVAATILVSQIKAIRKKGRSYLSQSAESIPILGENIDTQELRILRSLFGEARGRQLESFKSKYYRPFLEATIDKGWVKQVGRRYFMTPKGGEICRTYLQQLLSTWKPSDEV